MEVKCDLAVELDKTKCNPEIGNSSRFLSEVILWYRGHFSDLRSRNWINDISDQYTGWVALIDRRVPQWECFCCCHNRSKWTFVPCHRCINWPLLSYHSQTWCSGVQLGRESSGQWEDDFPRVWLQPSSLCPETWRVRSPAISFKLLLKYQSQRPDLAKIDGGLVGRRVIILLSQTKQKFSQCNYGKTNLIRVSFWPLPPSAPCDNFWQIFLECQYVSSGEFWIAGISAGDPLISDTSWSSPGLSYYCQITRITVYNILTSY